MEYNSNLSVCFFLDTYPSQEDNENPKNEPVFGLLV